MIIYCDMDMVLVHQTGRDGFESMPWMPDGKELWEFIRPYAPTLLSQLPDANYERCAPQKRAWAARELGAEVGVIVVKRSVGKAGHAGADCVLIDDSLHTHGKAWVAAGGVFVHHLNAKSSIAQLSELFSKRNLIRESSAL